MFSNLILKKEDIDVVVYHANCDDGFGAAYCAYRYFKETNPDKDVKYIPLSHNSEIPFNEFKNKNVCLFDFSFKAPDTMHAMKISKNFTVIDHHKTAVTELKDIPDENKVFRMDYSGAYLAWKFFFPDADVPKLIQYIQDNDLWTKKLPMTLEYTAYMNSVQNTFEEYERMVNDDELMRCIEINGSIILKQNDMAIRNIVEHACPVFMTIGRKHYMVAHINSNMFRSDVGNQSLKKLKHCNFSAVYSINNYNDSTGFSLRSMDDRADVSVIAQSHGGGGHRNASGMTINNIISTVPGLVHDKFDVYNNLRNIYYSTFDNNVVINLNANTHKQSIGEYLLQTRYVTKDGTKIQECNNIYQIENNNMIPRLCDMSAIWHYDGIKDVTIFTITFDDSVSDECKKFLIGKIKTDKSYCEGPKPSNNVFMFRGLRQYL